MRFILGVVSALALLGASAITMTILSDEPGASPNMASAAPASQPLKSDSPEVVTKSASIMEEVQIAPSTAPENDAKGIAVTIAGIESPAEIAPLSATQLTGIQALPKLQGIAFLSAQDAQSPTPPKADTTPAAPVEVLYVTGKRVNMRSGPGSRYQRVATLDRGTQLMVVEKGNRWHKVSGIQNGDVVRGWMARSFLSTEPVLVEASNASN